MRWRKVGRIFAPDGTRWWMRSHAASPVPILLAGDRVRALVSGRDEQSRARIGALEFSLGTPHDAELAAEPIARLGERGTFDENGMVGACAVQRDERTYIYYSGWQLGRTVPFWFFGGLLLSGDRGATAQRYAPVPVLDRCSVDPVIAGAPWILYDEGRFRMWYTSGVRWTDDEPPMHYYHVKYAESDDGLTWRRDGRVAIDFRGAEHAVGRPCVVRDADRYRMWFSYRGPAYRIGYAESGDGLTWERRDDAAGIDVSAAGWDSEMVEYAAVFDHAGARWMLYNGNGYGHTGVGLAVLDD